MGNRYLIAIQVASQWGIVTCALPTYPIGCGRAHTSIHLSHSRHEWPLFLCGSQTTVYRYIVLRTQAPPYKATLCYTWTFVHCSLLTPVNVLCWGTFCYPWDDLSHHVVLHRPMPAPSNNWVVSWKNKCSNKQDHLSWLRLLTTVGDCLWCKRTER